MVIKYHLSKGYLFWKGGILPFNWTAPPWWHFGYASQVCREGFYSRDPLVALLYHRMWWPPPSCLFVRLILHVCSAYLHGSVLRIFYVCLKARRPGDLYRPGLTGHIKMRGYQQIELHQKKIFSVPNLQGIHVPINQTSPAPGLTSFW